MTQTRRHTNPVPSCLRQQQEKTNTMKHIPNTLGDWLKSASVEINSRLILCAGGISGRYLEGIEKERGVSFHSLPFEEKRAHVATASTVERNVLDWQRQAYHRNKRRQMMGKN